MIEDFMNTPSQVCPDRKDIIINNILTEIVRTVWEDDNQAFLAWLRNEIGLSEGEIVDLTAKNCLPLPNGV